MDLEYENRLTEVENRSQSNTERLDEMEKRQVYPEMFGAVGDGVTDDTAALQEMVAYGKENNITTFTFPSHKTYLVSLPTIEMTEDWGVNTQNARKIFKIINVDFNNAVFDLNNSKIKVAPTIYPYYSVFYVSGNNCKISNGIIEGEKNEHDYETFIYRDEGVAATHEFGFGIEHADGINLIVDNLEIFNTTGDAIIAGGPSGICTTTIKNCNLHHCRRQGISMLDGDKIYVYDTKIHHIGTSDGVSGTSPMSGIDIEPNNNVNLLNYCYMRNVTIEQCTASAFIIGSNVSKVDMHNCDFEGIVNVSNAVNFYECNFTFDANSSRVSTAYSLKGSYTRCKFNFLDTSKFNYVSLVGEYKECEFHGEIDAENNSIALLKTSSCYIRKCRFYNIHGDATYKGVVINNIVDDVQPIDDCYFYNSYLALKKWKSDFVLSNCIFEKAMLLTTSGGMNYKFYNCDFRGSDWYAEATSTSIMDNCYFSNPTITNLARNSRKIIRNSFVELKKLDAVCFRINGGLICNSTFAFHEKILMADFTPAKWFNVQIDTIYNTQEELENQANVVNTHIVSTASVSE